jgi:hypothetical protein
MRFAAEGKVLAPNEGHQENNEPVQWPPYKTEKRCVIREDEKVYGEVDERVARFRERSLTLTIEREQEIANGLEHLSPAALRDKERITEDER